MMVGGLIVAVTVCAGRTFAQLPTNATHGDAVPRDVREMYERGLKFLVATQSEGGDWPGNNQGPGVTGMALMAFLASGEDPNYGGYAPQVRRAVKSMVDAQNNATGFFGESMYHHGFAMLGLAEAYGAVDDRLVWSDSRETSNARIGKALELAVRSALTSQTKNPFGAWRYSPESTDADTSVSGAVLVGLLAARNAGIEVPDKNIDRAIAYYTSMTSEAGHVAYSGGMGGFDESLARSSIASLVFALARRKDLPHYEHTLTFLKGNLENSSSAWPQYAQYYQSQALFQGDMDSWEKWNRGLVRKLKAAQKEDGSFSGQLGPSTDTPLSLLALALNFRFLPIYER